MQGNKKEKLFVGFIFIMLMIVLMSSLINVSLSEKDTSVLAQLGVLSETSTEPSADALVESARVLGEAAVTLRAIDLDPQFLDDPVFLSLKDFSRELPSEIAGRENPFMPIR